MWLVVKACWVFSCTILVPQCYIRPQYWTFAIWNTFKGPTPARSFSLELKIAKRGITVPMTGVWESLGDEHLDRQCGRDGMVALDAGGRTPKSPWRL